MNLNSSIEKHLQQNVCKLFGKQIRTATDCEDLSHLIYQKLNTKVSGQTLRRFFGLIKKDSEASVYTLNLLSRLCGFVDFQEFTSYYSAHEHEEFFADSDEFSKDYWRKSEDLCKQLMESPELLMSTHHRLMFFPLVRKYFMELHPMRDLLGTVYSQYFLSYLKFNKSNEAKIFAYGFLFHAAFLQQNTELMDIFHRRVKETKIDDEMHVIPCGLKYGVQLLYADFTSKEVEFKKIFREMKIVRQQFVAASQRSVCSFEYSVLEMLIFTDRKKEIQFLLNHQVEQTEKDKSYVPLDRKQTHEEVWKILCAVSYNKLGNEDKCKSYLDRVDLENLGVGWKNYFSILFRFTELEYLSDNEKPTCLECLEQLINKTYFFYFEEKLQRLKNDYSKQLVNELA